MTRGHALSDDLRGAILNMAHSLDVDNICKYTGCKKRTVQRILEDYRKKGSVIREHMRQETRGAKRRLTTGDIRFIRGIVRHSPDVYLDEIRELIEERCGTEVSELTIWRTLRRCGFTMKKLTREALERSAAKRSSFRYTWGTKYTPQQTVFVDESSFDRRTSIRNRAWALSGQRAIRKCFFVRGRRYSLLPALSLDGILHAKVVEGSFTAARFRDFIEGLLDHMQPFPNNNSVIVMDNARIHKDPEILNLIKARGVEVLFLPPYSPDYNPIELAFSSIKAFVRRDGTLGRTDVNQKEDDTYVYLHLIDAAFSVTPDDALGFFHHCGYI